MKKNTMVKNNKTNTTGTIINYNEETKKATVKFQDGTEKELSIKTLKDKRLYTLTEVEEVKPVKTKKAKAVKETTNKSKKTRERKTDRTNKKWAITYKGKTKTPAEWAKEFNLSASYIRNSIRKGKTPEEVFNPTPKDNKTSKAKKENKGKATNK